MPRKASLAFAHPNVLGAPTYMVLALAQLDAQSAYMVRSIVFAIGAWNNGRVGGLSAGGPAQMRWIAGGWMALRHDQLICQPDPFLAKRITQCMLKYTKFLLR